MFPKTSIKSSCLLDGDLENCDFGDFDLTDSHDRLHEGTLSINTTDVVILDRRGTGLDCNQTEDCKQMYSVV